MLEPMVSSVERACARVFGAFVPNDAKAARDHIDASPFAPTDPAAREAIFEHARAFLGQPLPYKHDFANRARSTARRTTAFDVAARQVAAAIRGGELEKVITPERAQQLFDQIAAAPDIPHDMVHEGCHFRAHLVAKRIDNEGVYTEKVWIRGEGDLRIASKHAQIGYTLAMFHNATMVYVDTGDLHPERWVIDPTVCDAAVPLTEWASHMRSLYGAPTECIYSPRFVAHVGGLYRETPSDWVPEDLEISRKWVMEVPALRQDMISGDFEGHLEELTAEAVKALAGASNDTERT